MHRGAGREKKSENVIVYFHFKQIPPLMVLGKSPKISGLGLTHFVSMFPFILMLSNILQ